MDKLKASAPARIVFVSSVAHEMKGKIDFTDIQNERCNSMIPYGRSKTANVLNAVHLAKLLQGYHTT